MGWVGRTGGEDARYHERVGQVGQRADAHVLHRDDVRTARARAGVAGGEEAGERGVVVGQDDADAEGAEDEEEAEAEVHCLEGGFYRLARVDGFAGDHGDVLGADAREGGLEEGAEEAWWRVRICVRFGGELLG